jgi:hypothetical protein
MSARIKRNNVPRIVLRACQFKSIGKLRLAAKLLEEMEVEFGVHACEIQMLDCFICPWITDAELDTLDKTGMEMVVRNMVRDLRKKNPAEYG